MNLALVSAINSLNAVTQLLNGGSLKLYSGTMPSSPEQPLSGNTLLATFTFASTAFGSASVSGGYEQQTASFNPSSVAPVANGTVTFARASLAGPNNWAAGAAYSYSNTVVNNSNVYFCTKAGTAAGAGGPSGNGLSITDNTVQWQYLGAVITGGTPLVVADFTVGTTGTDIIIGNATLSTTINVTITSFILQIPAV